MTLPLDIARCSGKNCPLRESCLRYLHRDSGWVWVQPQRDGEQCFDRLTEYGYAMMGGGQ